MAPAAPPLIQFIQVIIFTGLIGGSLAIWARVSVRLASGQPVLPAEPRRPAPWNLGHVAAIAAIYFLLQAGGALIVHNLFPSAQDSAEVEPVAAEKNENLPQQVSPEKAAEEQAVDRAAADGKVRAGNAEKGATEPAKEGDAKKDGTKNDPDEKIEKIDPRKMAAGILVHVLASLLSLVAAIPVLRVTAHCTWADLGIVPGKILSDVKLGIGGFAAAAVPIYGLQFALSRWSTKRHPIIDWLEKTPDVGFLVLAGISTVLVAPLAEEFFFRLIFQGWLENLVAYLWPKAGADRESSEGGEIALPSVASREMSDNPYTAPHESLGFHPDAAAGELIPPGGVAGWGPIVCSALIFALMHFDHGPAPIPLFFLALLLGYLYQQTHRIVPSIVVHCCLNSCSMLILWTSLWK